MATIQYARLYPDTTQLQAKDGHNLTAGWVEVYLAGTDDPATTYADFNGTVNPQKIVVDDNGRFTAIVDKSKAYRVEVYDADGMLQWTTEPVWCTGNAGAGMSVTRVVSTDGSIAVEENIEGSERTYDISIAPSDSDEFLEWIKCSEEDCGSTWYPVYQAGTMETEAGQGIKVHAGQLYHFTNTFYVDPNGTGINYDTFKAIMYCNDEIVDVRDFDIDSSLNDSVMCEFSTDLIPEADGVVYYKLTIPSTCDVTAEVQCHRIYSGINAVPDTCATKQWVQETFDYNLSGKVDYSAIEYNQDNEITGISGSAIAAASIDSAFVSGVASAYAESAISSISGWSGDFSSISSKIDWSSSGVFQPSGDYAYNSSLSSKADQSAFEQCCDEVHSALDEKLDKSASGEFQPSGDYVYESAYSSFSSEVTNNISSLSSTVSGISADMSAYVPFSGLEGEGGRVTGISGSAFKGHEYTGINPVTVDNTADTISVEHRTLCVDSTMTAYNSGDSAVIGVNVSSLDISSKLDASASSLFYPMDNPSGYITGVDLSPYQLTADMSAYAHESSLSSKLDASASGEFYPSSNPSGFLTAHQSLAGYATEAYVDSSVSSKLDTTAFSTVSGDFLTSHQSLAGYATESYVDSAVSGKLDVTASSQFLTSLPDDLAYTSDVASAVSGKMDKSESSSFYPMDSNPSGYLTAHQSLAGYATETYVDSAVSGKQDALTFGYDDNSAISSIDGSALAGGGATGDYYEKSSTELAYGTAASASRSSFSLGSASADYLSIGIGGDILGTTIATVGSISLGSNSAKNYSVALGRKASATGYSIAVGDTARAKDNSFAFAWATASSLSFAMGLNASAKNTAMVFGKNNLKGDGDVSTGHSAAFVIGDGTAANARHDLMLVTKDGEITMYSSTADTVGTGIMSSIRAISAAATGGVDSATVSSIASAYVESAVSSKQDTLTFDWDADSAISSINGSALAGQGGGASITAVSYDTATQQYSVVTATGFGIVGAKTNYPRVRSVYLTDGQTREIEANTLAPGAAQTASGSLSYTLLFSPPISMWTTADAATGIFSPLQYGTGAGLFMDSNNFKGFIKGNELFISNTALGRAARLEVHQNRGSRLGLTGNNGSATVNLKESELAIVNSAVSTATLGRTKLEFKSPVSGTGTYATNYINLYDTAESATKTISSTSIDYWNAKMDSAEMSAYVAKSAYDDLYSAFTALSGVISTYSAYFSSISSKVDNSAIGVTE